MRKRPRHQVGAGTEEWFNRDDCRSVVVCTPLHKVQQASLPLARVRCQVAQLEHFGACPGSWTGGFESVLVSMGLMARLE